MFKIQIPDDVKTVRTADAAREVSESHEDDGDHQRIPRQDYDKFQQYRTMLLVVHAGGPRGLDRSSCTVTLPN
jgi:hypothetical protein